MKISKRVIIVSVVFLVLSFLFTLSILEQSLSAELMGLMISSTAIVLWVIIPTVVSIVSLLVVGYTGDKFIRLVYVSITLLLVSNMTFLLFINLSQTDFGIILLVFCVWGSAFWFMFAFLIKLFYAYFFDKNIKEVIDNLLRIKVFKSILLSATMTFFLFQIYLLGNAIEVYKAVKVLKIEDKQEHSLLSFYKPFIYEIRLKNGMRWSYNQVKFVERGE